MEQSASRSEGLWCWGQHTLRGGCSGPGGRRRASPSLISEYFVLTDQWGWAVQPIIYGTKNGILEGLCLAVTGKQGGTCKWVLSRPSVEGGVFAVSPFRNTKGQGFPNACGFPRSQGSAKFHTGNINIRSQIIRERAEDSWPLLNEESVLVSSFLLTMDFFFMTW